MLVERIEKNANTALEIATRGYVLETGVIVNAASAEKLRQDPKVREAYLGEIQRRTGTESRHTKTCYSFL